MKQELEEKLVKDFPKTYTAYYKQEDNYSPISFDGISCESGWYDILSNCSRIVEEEINKLERFSAPLWLIPYFIQVKEKFGSLTIYCNWADYSGRPTSEIDCIERVRKAISDAEIASNSICEWCSRPGSKIDSGWIKTLCPECKEKKNQGYRPWLEK